MKWLFFGGDGIIADNEPEQQEESFKYGDLVANVVIFQNVVGLTAVVRQLRREGYYVDPNGISVLSPYLTEHIKRFSDYVIDLEEPPQQDPTISLTFNNFSPLSYFDLLYSIYSQCVGKWLATYS